METVIVELIKHGPLAVLLFLVLVFGGRFLERQVDIANAQRDKEISAGERQGEKELEILALRHDAATKHEREMEQIAQAQNRLLERLCGTLEQVVTTKAPRD